MIADTAPAAAHRLLGAQSTTMPPGTWLTALLEGLYTTWLGHMPGADKSLVARRLRASPDVTLLRYAMQPK